MERTKLLKNLVGALLESFLKRRTAKVHVKNHKCQYPLNTRLPQSFDSFVGRCS